MTAPRISSYISQRFKYLGIAPLTKVSGCSSRFSRGRRARKQFRSELPSRKASSRQRGPRPERERPPRRAPRLSGTQLDEEALSRREKGHSFSAIARSLELSRTKDAVAAFHRALRSRSDDERGPAVQRERDRLDGLETRIRTRDEADPEKRDRRLAALELLRNQLSGTAGGSSSSKEP